MNTRDNRDIAGPVSFVLKQLPQVMRYLVLLSACPATSGCFPYHYTARPGSSGKVVAAENRQPIVGAGIVFGSTNFPDIAQSAADGSFSIPPKKQWGIWIIPQDVFTRRYDVFVRRDGYATHAIGVPSNPADAGNNATKQLGVIPLTSSQESNTGVSR